jgi:hypothetical protein
MIIWNGAGFLVLVVGFGFFFLGDVVAAQLLSAEQLAAWSEYIDPVALGAAAVLVGVVGLALNAGARREQAQAEHTLFFVPMEYWAVVIAIVAVVLYFFGGELIDRPVPPTP